MQVQTISLVGRAVDASRVKQAQGLAARPRLSLEVEVLEERIAPVVALEYLLVGHGVRCC